MPNRLIKESICTSEEIDALSAFEEIVFYRLIVNCDDYGRMDARPKILKSRLFPLKNDDEINEKCISDAINTLIRVCLIIYYVVDGKPYLQMKTWESHQQVRAKKSKYPSPNEGICYQMISDDCKCPRNPIQSNTYSYSESNTNILAQSDQEADNVEMELEDAQTELEELNDIFGKKTNEEHGDAKNKKQKQEIVDDTPVVFQLMLNDKSMFDIHQSFIDESKALYPNVNIEQEFRNMIGWTNANPSKRKTKSGIMRFVNSWLSRQQNRGGNFKTPQVGPNGIALSQNKDTSLDEIF